MTFGQIFVKTFKHYTFDLLILVCVKANTYNTENFSRIVHFIIEVHFVHGEKKTLFTLLGIMAKDKKWKILIFYESEKKNKKSPNN